MSELGESLKLSLEKIAGFFDIFDLSFFVSGAVLSAGIATWAYLAHVAVPQIDGWLGVFAVILGCYVSGLICFAGGRWIRIGVAEFRRRAAIDPLVVRLLRAHGLADDEPIKAYLQRGEDLRGAWRLYVRLWAELRGSRESAVTLAFLNRYWVMAATYDGLGFALVVWIFVVLERVFGAAAHHSIAPFPGAVITGALLLFAIACFREASRYVDYQAEELVAAIAVLRSR